jgi:hypothetical protein
MAREERDFSPALHDIARSFTFSTATQKSPLTFGSPRV